MNHSTSKKGKNRTADKSMARKSDPSAPSQAGDAVLQKWALQNAIFNSANFSSIATDAKGVIQIFNVGAERLLGYTAGEVMNKITPADISDPQELVARAKALSIELDTTITPGFEALVFKASRGIEDIYELSYIRKDGSRFPAVVSVTALRDGQNAIIGYLLIGTDNTARKQAETALQKAGALQSAIFNSANFSSIATDAKGVIQIFNVGAERMLGYTAGEVMNKITPADISDPKELVARAKALSIELETTITPGFEALVFKASRGIEDIYELSYIRKDGSRFPAVVSVTALRDGQNAIIGYLLIGTDNTARKQAETALLKAGALQRAIFNSANFSSIATDAKGVIQIFNVGAEQMLGYTAAEVMNKITPADISDPQEVIARAQALSTELKTTITPGFEALVFKASRGIEDIYELSYIRKDGSRFPAVVSVTALRDGQNAIIGYLLIGTDNTARKQAETALLKAGALQRAIFNSANFSSIATDAKGVIQIFNVGAEQMLGYTAAEVMNKITPADISDPQEVIARAQALSTELKTTITPGFEALVFKASRGIEDIYELTYIRKDGSRFPALVSVTALRDEQNIIIGYLLIGTDNTARKEGEEVLRRYRDHLEEMVRERTAQLVDDITQRKKAEARIEHLNHVLLAIRDVNRLIARGSDRQRLIEDTCGLLVKHRGYSIVCLLITDEAGALQTYAVKGEHPAFKPMLEGIEHGVLPACCEQAKLQQGGNWNLSSTLLNSNPTATSALPSSQLICTHLKQNSKGFGYLLALSDSEMGISTEEEHLFVDLSRDLAFALHNIEQREAIKEADKVRERMENELRQAQKMEAVGRLAGGVAHDFNNMLSVILGYTDLLLSKVNSDHPFYASLNEILSAGERSAGITKQLLAFSRKQTAIPKVLKLDEVLAKSKKMLGRLVGEEIHLKVISTGDLWNIRIDPTQIDQILANLVVNGRDAIPGVGTITIEMANSIVDESMGRHALLAVPGDYVMLAVRDTGCGIDEANIEQIFEPFFTTKAEGKGTGLGLSTVFGIVKQNGGIIHVYSEPNIGTTFKIYFPRFVGAEDEITVIEDEPIPNGNETILIAEDEKAVLNLVVMIIQECGYKVLPANNPAVAIQLAEQYQGEIHLLLTDLVMPTMNGKELCERMQAMRPGMKTLFMSGYTSDIISDRGLVDEGLNFIHKPISREMLLRKIRAVLDEGKG